MSTHRDDAFDIWHSIHCKCYATQCPYERQFNEAYAAGRESLLPLISKVRSRLFHQRARYEGDGDPGCYSSCLACWIDAALGVTSESAA